MKRALLFALALVTTMYVNAAAATATLQWDANAEPDVAGYLIQYGTQSGVYTTSIDVGNQTRVVLDGLTSGRRYYFAVQAYTADGALSELSREVTPPAKPHDFDADSKTDITVWRPSTGIWHVLESSTGYSQVLAVPWGAGWTHDRPVPGDYDGDLHADYAVWRPDSGDWHFLLSSLRYAPHRVNWGLGRVGDRPVPADYDGDGKTDPAVWRGPTGFWYVLLSGTQYRSFLAIEWGKEWAGDLPVPADFDGDGCADFAIWRQGSGTWYVLLSSRQYRQPDLRVQWGLGSVGDVPAVADYDGDGRADIAVWRKTDGVWYVLSSSTGFSPAQARSVRWGLGAAGDVPVPADYDGDRKADFTVWRETTGTWHMLMSAKGYTAFTKQWGTAGDVPVPR